MTYSEIKDVLSDLIDEFDTDAKEILRHVLRGEKDFTIQLYDGEYRFIVDYEIDKIQCEELEADEYVLGCFNAGFLSDILSVPYEVIELIQGAEAFEALGKWIVQSDKLGELQEEYVQLDGYGHHFSSYDGETRETYIYNDNFYYFRIA